MRHFLAIMALVTLSACFWSEDEGETLRLSGETMGTTYNIVAVDVPGELTGEQLLGAVEAQLKAVNASMSNWDPNSEVSLFNASDSIAPVSISSAFAHVVQGANQVHVASEGKFDVTLGPLIDLWGFGAKKPGDPIPDSGQIDAALAQIGQGTLLSLEGQMLAKSLPEASINLSGIAKGYGADAVAEVLRELGIERYLVEIGGDLVSAGLNPQGKPWFIGIERPDAQARAIEMILPVSDKGMATSGDYRNYFEQDGVRYSHLIDPTTGYPVTHRTTSVTVIADSGMLADAWATAMMIVGDEDGLRIAQANNLAVYFISRAPAGSENEFVTRASSAFEKLMETD
ncbi:thiamin biosynthesis lipoprotein ApbE [Actibacterium atlanticum]|uniref:FAD:protein FMN transferase n=1 Tax=Actibacterium atlanticum TaxID=1461693 RepID=A0A058ZNT7_9RHOB|nr:FAD:protein FMN transferase [Actibacterium atlanticum]KCV82847.1 thiamin biosynthesis lipoprotein ApbE [Actibacterium atlanticum]